jgi:hypothetical protein
VGDAAFGIDARLVLEVVKVGEVTPVHGAPPGVSGVRNRAAASSPWWTWRRTWLDRRDRPRRGC